jgi:short-subunit dehydrogenase
MENVVITGSTRGLGKAMAIEFLKSGCNVTLSGRSAELPEELKKDVSGYAGSAQYVPCNARIRSDIENLWNIAASRWGKVDIWINNAGQSSPHEFAFDTDASHTEAVIDTNIKGMIFGSQIAAKKMLEQGAGRIFNVEGLGSNNMIQQKTILYGTTKCALTYFSKGLAKELNGTNVRAGRLSPGMMLTDFILKTPDGEKSPVIGDKNFRYVFNALADRPETVARFFVSRILKGTKNDAHIVWLTGADSAGRFLRAPFTKRDLFKDIE